VVSISLYIQVQVIWSCWAI